MIIWNNKQTIHLTDQNEQGILYCLLNEYIYI